MQKTIENGVTVLTADDGMKLTNGEAFGTVVRLGVLDNEDNWQEITEEEAERLMMENMQDDNEPTAADYQSALSEFGVKL